MTTDRDFDRIARMWLTAGPDELPERVVDAVADEIHHTRQRHVLHLPRRFPPMFIPARTAAILVLAALVAVAGLAVVGGAGRGPAPSNTPSPEAAADATFAPIPLPYLTRTFISPRNGLRVNYPGAWTVTPATSGWLPGTSDWYGSAALDVLQGPDARFVAAAQLVPDGMTDADWLMAWCRSLATEVECTNVPARWPTVQIVGMPGYVVTDGDQGAAGIPVTSNARLYQAIVIVANVAYDLRLDGNVDRAYFDALIATMQLAPSDVGDPSPQP